MGCGCGGGAKVNAMTTHEVNQMLAEQAAAEQAALKTELEAMVASIGQAAANANSGESALR